MPGIWVSDTEYMEFSEIDKNNLAGEMATRQAAWDWFGFVGLMPDPDPVLRKLSDGGVSVLESLSADAHLCSVMQTRKIGTLKKEYKFSPGSLNGEKPTSKAERLCADLLSDLENIDLYSLISGILDAPYYGISPIEIVWAPSAGRIRIADIAVKPARWFGYDSENTPRFLSMDNPWLGRDIPFGKFVFARHFPTYDNPYGLRLLSRCFWPVAFKKGGVKFWAQLAEKYGMPFLVGKYRPGAGKGEQQEMLNNLAAMVQDAIAVIPQGDTVEMLETANKSTDVAIHKGLCEYMDSAMSKVVMGQTQTAEIGTKGSQASATVHEDILEDYRASDQTLVKTAMEEIAWLYGRVNAVDAKAPIFTWFEEDDPKSETATRDKTLGETGVVFRKSYFVRQYGLQEDDFDIAPAPAGRPKNAAAGAFAEPGAGEVAPGDRRRFTAEQQAIEDFADGAVSKGVAALSENERKIIEAVRNASGYEDAMTKIMELYPGMDMTDMEDLMSKLWINAELYGASTVQDGAK